MPQWVIRLNGDENHSSYKLLADFPVSLVNNLDEAIAQTISLAKAAVKRA